MVRGRQLEELAPALLLPLFSLTTFLFSTTTKNLASRNNLQVSLCNYKGAGRLALIVAALPLIMSIIKIAFDFDL
jgi:hypothetical protein